MGLRPAMAGRLATRVGGARHPDRRRRGARRGAASCPPLMVATEGWPPNVATATALLHPRGVAVVADADEPPLPFADGGVRPRRQPPPGDGVVGRDRPGAAPGWHVLLPAGRAGERVRAGRVVPRTAARPRRATVATRPGPCGAEAAGLEVVDLRTERLRIEFFDVGAVVWFLRKVIWMVPGFTVDRVRAAAAPAARADRARRPVRRHDDAPAGGVPPDVTRGRRAQLKLAPACRVRSAACRTACARCSGSSSRSSPSATAATSSRRSPRPAGSACSAPSGTRPSSSTSSCAGSTSEVGDRPYGVDVIVPAKYVGKERGRADALRAGGPDPRRSTATSSTTSCADTTCRRCPSERSPRRRATTARR